MVSWSVTRVATGLLHDVSGLRVKWSPWAAVPSISGHQGILEKVHCTHREWCWGDGGWLCLHMQDIFHLPLPNPLIPAGGYLGERGLITFSMQSLVVDPQNLGNGSSLCSVTELPENGSNLCPFCLHSIPWCFFSFQSVFLAQKCCVVAPATSCLCVLLPTPAHRSPTSLQSHPLCVAVTAQSKEGDPKCG